MAQIINIILHLDTHLASWTAFLGAWTYVLLFLIIFCETGLVVMPFLPGDSLLFAAGAIASINGSSLQIHILVLLLILAGILGDFVNYSFGKSLGPKIFNSSTSKWLNKGHLDRTQLFYERHGPRTIIIARFAPIIRTFAPFVAGMGRMNYSRFIVFNATGSLLWVSSFLYAGFFFGNIPSVKTNFHLVIIGVVLLSLAPVFIAWYQSRTTRTQKESL